MAGGEPLGFNNAVFLSEREAADRNYALGFYMREHKCYPDKTNLRECMDFYFQVSIFIFSVLLITRITYFVYIFTTFVIKIDDNIKFYKNN